MKQTLITGATGFIGGTLSELLPDAKLFDRRHHDFFKPESLQPILANVDTIVHLAAVNAGSGFNPPPRALIEGNLDATARLIRAIQLYGQRKPKVIFLSTINVYEAGHSTLTETTPIGPASTYGTVKYAQEVLLGQAAAMGLLDLIVLRCSHVFGPRAKPFYNSAVATFCFQALQGLPLHLQDQGRGTLDLIHVREVSEYIRRATEVTMAAPVEIFNLATGRSVPLIEIITQLEALLGTKVKIESLDRPAFNSTIDVRRLHQRFGRVPNTELRTGLAQQLEFLARAVRADLDPRTAEKD